MDELSTGKMTQNEFMAMIDPMAKDMTAVFMAIEEEITRILAVARKENWTDSQIQEEIEKILS